MSLALIKKRRGRPPKYLYVWKQQYLENLQRKQQEEQLQKQQQQQQQEEEEEDIHGDKPGQTIDSKMEEEGASEKSPVSVIVMGDTGRASPVNLVPAHRASPYSPGTLPPSLDKQSPGSTPATSPLPLNLPISPTSPPSTPPASATSDVVDAKRELKLELGLDEDLTGKTKRKPGRPVGSTKRPKQTCGDIPFRQVKNSSDEFSLRKFFEAGGRDYNEYMEWLKKRGTLLQQSALLQRGSLQFPGMLIPSQSSGGHPIPMPIAGFPFQQQQQQPRLMTSFGPKSVPMAMYSPREGFTPLHMSPPTPTSPGTVVMAMTTGLRAPITPSPSPDDCVLDLSNKTRQSTEDERQSHTNRLFDRMRRTMHTGSTSSELESSKSESDSPFSLDSGHPVSPEIPSNLPQTPTDSDLTTWDVEHVAKFVSTVPGCQDYAEVFREHRIDGATLPHLSEDHLLKFVNMKLGPAIRLRLEVSRLTTLTT